MIASNEKVQEALDLLQEECGEVIVEVSKCRRFGLEGIHAKTHRVHADMLAMEVADVLTLVDLLIEMDVISEDMLKAYKKDKLVRLAKWSTLFKD